MNPPKPTALKVLEGTARSDRANPSEPRPEPGARKPDRMSRGGSAEWDRLAPMLARLGLLRETDALALEDLCETTALWRRLRSRRDFRSAAASDRARDHMLRVAMQFGMTPSSATRVTATPAEAESDPLERWAAR